MPGRFLSTYARVAFIKITASQGLRQAMAWRASDDPPSFDVRRDKGLRRGSNKGTLRAFRNADRFPTFKIFRRPGASSPNESTAVFSLPVWPFQLNRRIESQLRSYRESGLQIRLDIR